ncbi:NAD(P)-binding protein [Patellaria atrata CBS 101060]|uniref:NAD(P)-binding protein n=1 Tax=Patellaria atrata CBS 101060 TaxID=1346257 RepID=A0A9P4VQ17_9PEZI|nr:NAD(P)-binding protein [Patellaria atrata CBS 101060]
MYLIPAVDASQGAVNYYEVDISSRYDVSRVLQQVKPKVIFHTATPNPFTPDHTLLERVNDFGTRNLIKCSKEVGTGKAFFYTSSSSIVRDHRNPLVKAKTSQSILAANRTGNDMLTVTIRPASIYGEGDELTTGNLIRNARSGHANIQIGSGRNMFDNTYERVEGEAFFVISDDPHFFWDTSRLVASIAEYSVEEKDVRTIPYWLMMLIAFLSEWIYWVGTLGRKRPKMTRWVVRLVSMERTFCIEKIKTRLGYRPLFNTEESMRRAVGWFLDQDHADETSKKVK